MQQGTITNLHIARVKETPSDPVQEAAAISGLGLEGDRSCREGNMRQVLIMDNETLGHFGLAPGQIKENITTTRPRPFPDPGLGQVVFIGDEIMDNETLVTMEIVGECEPCGKMDAIRQGLQAELNHRRGMLCTVINGGAIKVGDNIRVEP
jgi:MOSC domain-containing protein YiiM